jgi:hypothetical protein
MYASLPVPPGTYEHLVASGDQTCALDVDGNATCWAAGSSTAPVRYPGPFVDFDAGGPCGLSAAGDVKCFNTALPTLTDSFVQLAAGANYVCALRADGTPDCWARSMISLPRFPPGSYVRLSYGSSATPWCVLRGSGGMTCWASVDTLENSPQVGFIDIAPNGLPCGLTVDRRVNCWGLSGAEYPHE